MRLNAEDYEDYIENLKTMVVPVTAVLLLTLIGWFGPVSTAGAEPDPAQSSAEQSAIGTEVILNPGDVLDIKFFHVPELNESQTIRPDGKITLQLVDEVEIEGKTPAEVRDLLVKLYSDKLRQTEITVIVRELPNRVVYVAGEVTQPGVVKMPGKLSALEAIMEAGGFKMEFARMNKVMVIRQKNGERQYHSLDMKAVLSGKKGAMEPFYLKPHDIIYVPR